MIDNLLKSYTVVNKIGEGSFSEVLKVKDKSTGALFAAKRLTKLYVSLDEVNNCTELRTLQKLEYHPNILSLVNYAFDANDGVLTLIFDLMDMSLYDFIKDRKKSLSETRCKNFLFQLVQGLKHLHSSGIFHRDIKPENILIRTDPRLKAINPLKSELVQLADLGSVSHTDFPLPHTAYISTRWYRAPECLLSSGFYGPKMDIWALGCCFYEILTFNPLFPGENEIDQLHKIHEILGSPAEKMLDRFKHRNVTYEFPKKKSIGFHNLIPSLSAYGVDVLKKTLVYHPELRISSKKLLEHLYFDELQAKNKAKSRNLAIISKSLTSSPCSSKPSSSSSISRRKSLNASRDSLSSNQSIANKKTFDPHHELNKKLERGWGMNTCPVKTKILGNIKSSMQSQKKSNI
jgi:renal tumor antigen